MVGVVLTGVVFLTTVVVFLTTGFFATVVVFTFTVVGFFTTVTVFFGVTVVFFTVCANKGLISEPKRMRLVNILMLVLNWRDMRQK